MSKPKPLTASQQALASLSIAKPASPAPARSACHKLSISLFDADIAAMDGLIDRLWQECAIRASRSDAVKLALRRASGAMDTEALRAAWREVKAEDGRR